MSFPREAQIKGGKNGRRGKDSTAELIRAQLSGDLNVPLLMAEIAELTLKERVDAKLRVLNMILPRLQAVELSAPDLDPRNWSKLTHEERLEALNSMGI